MKIIIILSLILSVLSLRINKNFELIDNDLIEEEYEDTINILYRENGKIKEKSYHKHLCPLLDEIFIEGHYHELDIEERLKIEHEYLTEIYTKENFPNIHKDNINVNVTSENSYKYYLFYCSNNEARKINFTYLLLIVPIIVMYYYYKNNLKTYILPYYVDKYTENKTK